MFMCVHNHAYTFINMYFFISFRVFSLLSSMLYSLVLIP